MTWSETWPRGRACLIACSEELRLGVKKPELHALCSGRWTWISPPVDEACRCPCDHPNIQDVIAEAIAAEKAEPKGQT